MRILILGGTSEARQLAGLIADDPRFDATISLAGRTETPKVQPIKTRTGGFGGVEGLSKYIAQERIAVVIDATHPFAAQISKNATDACRYSGVPLISLARPAWVKTPEDRWVGVPDVPSAVAALGQSRQRVFLSLGRLNLAAFAAAPQHSYIARTIDPPGGEAALPPDINIILARPPFSESAERDFLTSNAIDIVVSKNSGGEQTYGKIAAARALNLPVVMIDRPKTNSGEVRQNAEDIVEWLDALVSN